MRFRKSEAFRVTFLQDGWQYKTIDDLCVVDQESLGEKTKRDHVFYYIDISSVSEGRLILPADKAIFREAPSRARKVVHRGDVLMSTVRPNLKAFVYFNQTEDDCVASTGFAVLTARDQVDARFILHSILSDDVTAQIESLVVGSNYPAINPNAVRRLRIFAPPYPEQAKIAEILSTVDRAIEQTEKLIAKQQRIKGGLMQDLLTCGIDEHGNLRSEQTHKFKDSPLGRIPVEWAVTELQKTSQVIDCLHRTPTFSDDGYPMVRVTDIKPGELSLLKCIRVSETVFGEFTCNHVPQTGDIVMSRVGTYGVSSFVSNELAFCIGQNTVIITGHRYSRFLFEFLQTPVVRDYFELNLAGSSQKTLSLKAIRETPIPELEPEEMKRITAVLICQAEGVGTLCTHLSKLRYLKAALMQGLLSGKKRVTALLNGSEVTII
jgi:type I restriction enzyme S subunit